MPPVPYADPEAQRAYQREWCAGRRAKWLDANGPCGRCGSTEELEVHHLDPEAKVDHRVWSWSAARQAAELAKCVVLCSPCHKDETRAQRETITHGTHAGYSGPHACRCEPCTAAHAKYERERRARRGTVTSAA